jgi:hypothetical protein
MGQYVEVRFHVKQAEMMLALARKHQAKLEKLHQKNPRLAGMALIRCDTIIRSLETQLEEAKDDSTR